MQARQARQAKQATRAKQAKITKQAKQASKMCKNMKICSCLQPHHANAPLQFMSFKMERCCLALFLRIIDCHLLPRCSPNVIKQTGSALVCFNASFLTWFLTISHFLLEFVNFNGIVLTRGSYINRAKQARRAMQARQARQAKQAKQATQAK